MKQIADTLAAHPSIALSSAVATIGFKALMWEWVTLIFMITSVIVSTVTICTWAYKLFKCMKGWKNG